MGKDVREEMIVHVDPEQFSLKHPLILEVNNLLMFSARNTFETGTNTLSKIKKKFFFKSD